MTKVALKCFREVLKDMLYRSGFDAPAALEMLDVADELIAFYEENSKNYNEVAK